MTISRKLYFGYAAALLITLVIGVASIRNLGVLGDEMTNLGTTKTRNLYLTGDVDNLTSDILGATRGINLRAHMNDMAASRKSFEQSLSETQRTRTEAAEFAANDTKVELKEQMQTRVLDRLPAYLDLVNQDEELITKGNLPAADALFTGKLYPLMDDISNAADEINQGEVKTLNDYAATAVSAVAPARNVSIGLVLLGLAVGGALLWVVKGINSVLQGSIAELSDGASQVASAAQQVSSSSQSLAQGASEQAASLQETSASSEEINSMAHKNTENALAMAQLVGDSKTEFVNTNRQLGEMMTAMDEINESSGKIAKIIKIIDEIAFQTNILALNAAVEAARAGDAGMGFAVVADEVRSLAQRSAQAAKDTATLIEDSVSKSIAGKTKLGGVVTSIQRISGEFTGLGTLVDEVSHGSKEQSIGIEQIGKTLSQMEHVTQTTAANAEESAAASEELTAQSESMRELMERLNTLVGAPAGSSNVSSPYHRSGTRPKAYSLAPRVTTAVKVSGRLSSSRSKPEKSAADGFPMEDSFSSF
jgi:methyl-accepting chemotaxis protein/methyl-accepting chemotaxis protein-1 (serine sensor receptor)